MRGNPGFDPTAYKDSSRGFLHGMSSKKRFTMNRGIRMAFGKTSWWPSMAGIAMVGVTAFLVGGCSQEQGTAKAVPSETSQPSVVLSGDVINVTQWVENRPGSFDGRSVVPADVVVVRNFPARDLGHSWSPVLSPSHEAVTVLKEGLGNRAYAGSGARSPMSQPLIDFGSSTW
jgi:hypothetical protein